jgi:hypothetical protein
VLAISGFFSSVTLGVHFIAPRIMADFSTIVHLGVMEVGITEYQLGVTRIF